MQINKSNQKAQGALEYLLIIGASILVVAIVIIALVTLSSSATEQTQEPSASTHNPLKEKLADAQNKHFIPQGTSENYIYSGPTVTLESLKNSGKNISVCIENDCDSSTTINDNTIIAIKGINANGTIPKTNLELTEETQTGPLTFTQTLTTNFRNSATLALNPSTEITLQDIANSNQLINSIFLSRPTPSNYYILNLIKIDNVWKTRSESTIVNLQEHPIQRLDSLIFGDSTNETQEFNFNVTGTLPSENDFISPGENHYIIQIVKDFDCLSVQSIFNDLNDSKTINEVSFEEDEYEFYANLAISTTGTLRQMGYGCYPNDPDCIDYSLGHTCYYSESPFGDDIPINQFTIINLNYSNITLDKDIEDFFKCP